MAVHSSFCTGWVFSYDLDAAAQANRDEIAKLAEVGLGAALSRPCAWGMVAACCAVLCCAVLTQWLRLPGLWLSVQMCTQLVLEFSPVLQLPYSNIR